MAQNEFIEMIFLNEWLFQALIINPSAKYISFQKIVLK